MASLYNPGACSVGLHTWLPVIAYICQVALEARVAELRILACQELGLTDHDSLSMEFAGHELTGGDATMHQIGLCDEAVIRCMEATEAQRQSRFKWSKTEYGDTWQVWIGKQHKHSEMGGDIARPISDFGIHISIELDSSTTTHT